MNLAKSTFIINMHGRILLQRSGHITVNGGVRLLGPYNNHLGLSRLFSNDKITVQRPNVTKEEFRVFDVKGKGEADSGRKQKFRRIFVTKPPRSNQMPVDQDWPNVWPGPRSFHPASVPLPVRQGFVQKGAPPGKFGNAELMKIPNFLHLTPPAIKRQCKALKQFCTAWPAGLRETNYKDHFPLEVISSDYVHSSPVIRNPLSRIVSVKVSLDTLPLDSHARDKMLRLVGERYNTATDEITIVADRCPLRQQNYDFAMYILTALFHESWKVEPWESEKSEADMEYYDWNNSVSRSTFMNLINWPDNASKGSATELPTQAEYKQAVSELFNVGEDQFTVEKYKEATKKLLLTQSKPMEEMQ